jgi:hypothetical protein
MKSGKQRQRSWIKIGSSMLAVIGGGDLITSMPSAIHMDFIGTSLHFTLLITISSPPF